MSSVNCSGLASGTLLQEICYSKFNESNQPIVVDPSTCFNADLPLGFLDDNLQCANYTSANQKLAGMLGEQSRIDLGNTAWILIASALVFIMTPGIGIWYSGLSSKNSSINTILMSFVTTGIVTVQWYLFGYSFAFGPGDLGFGSFAWGCLQGGVGVNPSGGYGLQIPHIAFVAFQCMFAQITPAIISGAIIGRMKFASYLLFVFIWTTIIYDPLAHWVWAIRINPDTGLTEAGGWLGALGAADFAGGTVIHIASGFSSLAAALIVGPRHRNHREKKMSPSHVPYTMLGGAFIWFGWFGFNAGSAGGANGIAGYAFINTHLAAATAAMSWMLVEFLVEKKISTYGGVTGAIAGLVAITPAAGYVVPWAAPFFGFIVSPICYATGLVIKLTPIDDTLDSFAVHGMGGCVGAFLTGLFANPSVNIFTGAFYGNPILLGYQMAAICTAATFSFVGTIFIMYLLKFTIGLRIGEDQELLGIDRSEHGVDFTQEEARKEEEKKPAANVTGDSESVIRDIQGTTQTDPAAPVTVENIEKLDTNEPLPSFPTMANPNQDEDSKDAILTTPNTSLDEPAQQKVQVTIESTPDLTVANV